MFCYPTLLDTVSRNICVLGPFPQTCFMGYDRDRSGSVDAQELKQALTSFGYNLSPQALGVIMKRYSSAGKIVFDSFVGICVRMRLITSKLFENLLHGCQRDISVFTDHPGCFAVININLHGSSIGRCF